MAPGATNTCPFPRMDPPGVMTPGAAQQLVKSQGWPRRRVLLAGTGPFLWWWHWPPRGGCAVVGIVDTLRRRSLLAVALAAVRRKIAETGIRLRLRVRKAGIPLLTGHIVTRAEGHDGSTGGRGTVRRGLDPPNPSRSRPIVVDTLCVGYGFVPRIDLAQLAGWNWLPPTCPVAGSP
ncbi:MAG: hypothetical protein CM1200mP2_35920 [Planctomycetaceae bacterium]|nr:MAG: hypothetical protein CM1200mP2_35920 [Planctomycetaceae bacterium]